MRPMNALEASDSNPPYDLSSKDGINEAKFNLLFKVCLFVNDRLELYLDDIRTINRDILIRDRFLDCYTTQEGYNHLFESEPHRDRKPTPRLVAVMGSFRNFWSGFNSDFTTLVETCTSSRACVRTHAKKYYLFFRSIMIYGHYVSSWIMLSDFSNFDESQELIFFLGLAVATQDLLCDLLTLSVKNASYSEYQKHETKMTQLVKELQQTSGLWKEAHFQARGCQKSRLYPESVNGICTAMDFAALSTDDAYVGGIWRWE